VSIASLETARKSGISYLVNAHRPAQDTADATMLPMTVFYHRDWGFSWAECSSPMIQSKGFELHVTWLPINFFA
jgi:hypothetical protein